MISTMRLYGASIAIVSGVYSLIASVRGSMLPPMMSFAAPMGLGSWIMLIIGAVVLIHGLVLLTPLSAGLRRSSGPLMIAWSMIMLANQLLLGGSMGGMTADGGMVAIAVLMLISGLIMTARRETAGGM